MKIKLYIISFMLIFLWRRFYLDGILFLFDSHTNIQTRSHTQTHTFICILPDTNQLTKEKWHRLGTYFNGILRWHSVENKIAEKIIETWQ